MLVGVSSQNFRTITSHAGKGRRFLVFDVDAQGHITHAPRIELEKAETMHETAPGLGHPLDALDVLITGSAGAGFLRKMDERGVRVVMTSLSDPEDAVNRWSRGETLPEAAHDGHTSAHPAHRHADDKMHSSQDRGCQCGH